MRILLFPTFILSLYLSFVNVCIRLIIIKQNEHFSLFNVGL